MIIRRPRELARLSAAIEAAPRPVELTGTTRSSGVNGWGVGMARLAPFEWAPPTEVWSREAAMSVPSVKRARDLICSAVGALPIVVLSVSFDGQGMPVEARLPPPPWVNRLDPNVPRQHTLAWLTDDLFFNAVAYLHVTSRYEATGWPISFEQMRACDVSVERDGRVRWRNSVVDPADVIQFVSPLDGILATGYRTISTAINLDAAAERFSTVDIAAGWLAQREGSEPLDGDELTAMAEQWVAARRARTVAALNPFIEWHESQMDPTRLQLLEARQHSALELARLCNIPPNLIGAPTGNSLTYANTVQAKQDLVDFGAMPYIGCIEQTLGGPNMVPRNQAVRLDVNAWLRNPYVSDANASIDDLATAYNQSGPGPSQPPAAGPGRPRQADGTNEGTPA